MQKWQRTNSLSQFVDHVFEVMDTQMWTRPEYSERGRGQAYTAHSFSYKGTTVCPLVLGAYYQ